MIGSIPSLPEGRKLVPLFGLTLIALTSIVLIIAGLVIRFDFHGQSIDEGGSDADLAESLRLSRTFEFNVSGIGLADWLPASVAYPYGLNQQLSAPYPLYEEQTSVAYSRRGAMGDTLNEIYESVSARRLLAHRKLPIFPKSLNFSLGALGDFSVAIAPEITATNPIVCPSSQCSDGDRQAICELGGGTYSGLHQGLCTLTSHLTAYCLVIDADTLRPSASLKSCKYPFGPANQEYQVGPLLSQFFSVEVIRSDDPRIVFQRLTGGTMRFLSTRNSSTEFTSLACLIIGALLAAMAGGGLWLHNNGLLQKAMCGHPDSDSELHPIATKSPVPPAVRQQAFRMRMQYYRLQRAGNQSKHPPLPIDHGDSPAMPEILH